MLSVRSAWPCTNFLITKGASADGSTMVTYAADAHVLYGELYHTPARSHLAGEMLDVYEWDTGKYLGQIEQIPETFNVVGNMNEHQVAVGETTWGGRKELRDPQAIMDYGSLIYIGLQRAKTAREMITVMTELVAKYGYYSSGESISIADPNEVWLFEIIGKGPQHKGAVWVARKIPDGFISGHANNARIRQFPLDDPENTLYAPDVISFARAQGYFDGPDKKFSFADAYNPLDFGAVRFCDSRVWCMYKRAAPSTEFPADWVTGVDGAEPLPLWIKPDKKLSVRDVMELMRDHFEDTELDMTADIGAGPYELPYRWRPLTWEVDGQKYLNERATSTQQTGFSFVSQSRSWLPDPIGGVLWFGVDDTYSTAYVPMYCGIRKAPVNFAVGTGTFQDFTWDSAFWVFNFVSNYTYHRYSDMIRDVQVVQREWEGKFMANQARVDAAALALHKQSPQLAVDYLTEYSAAQSAALVKRWRHLGEELIVKYLDGNVRDELGKVTHPGYPESWYRKVAEATGRHLEMRKLKRETESPDSTGAAAKLASGILKLLDAREISLTDDQRSAITVSTNEELLKGWLIKSATVESADLLFDDH
jgi:dipeptidase